MSNGIIGEKLRNYDSSSLVEQVALKSSPYDLMYPPTEKVGVIVVKNFPLLGKLTALRFLEWVLKNPDGVVSLPTGKTPEYFIKWVMYYLTNWKKSSVRKELARWGIEQEQPPAMENLTFVQIDEFYPIEPQQHNSFYYYVNRFYLQGFGIPKENALLIDPSRVGIPEGKTMRDVFPDYKVDLNLRFRQPKTRQERLQKKVIQAVDEFCNQYETQIREMGGIGFFLGGIGPDGHIAFNVQGSDLYSTTRLTPTNYETQAAAATDLGGIEVARNRHVITIGLSTIVYNPTATAIIIAAGEAKARVVADAIQQEKSILYPATILQDLKASRFFITRGAAKLLEARQCEDLKRKKKLTLPEMEKLVVDFAHAHGKRVRNLDESELRKDPKIQLALERYDKPVPELLEQVEKDLHRKIQRGLAPVEGEVFLHTGPHHDDIMLGYLPYVYHLVRTPKNIHHFAILTSGFTAVTNHFCLRLLENLMRFIDTPEFKELMEEDYFNPKNELAYNRDVYQYLDGISAHSRSMKNEAEARRLLRILITIFEENNIPNLKDRIRELMNYFQTQYPGKKDLPYIQQLKGMIREWEEDLIWAHFGFNSSSVHHLRLGFYTGDVFTEIPKKERDIRPIYELIKKIRPTIITVALDPEGSGPDTHYKVLQAITEAVKLYLEENPDANLRIWGYRNVWYRFHPSEANIFVPVSLNSMAVMENAFLNCYGSQRDASFPSYELDGPFSRLAQKIMAEQYLTLKTCLGRQYFYENEHPRLRATHGLNFLKEMSLKEFFRHSETLKAYMEAQVELV